MRISPILVVEGLFLLIIVSAMAADTDLSTILDEEAYCEDDSACVELCEYYDLGECYCNLEFNSCFLSEVTEAAAEDNASIASSADSSAIQQEIATLEEQITVTQSHIENLKSKVSTAETDLASLQTRMFTLQQQVESLEGTYEERFSTVSTGLAGLQQTVETTQENLSAVNEQLAEEKGFTKLMTTILYMLLFVVLVAGGGYYVMKKKIGGEGVHPHIASYITEHIKQGKKFHHVKENLQRAGWKDEDIEQAYKQTMKVNYQKYKSDKALPLGGADKRKVIAIICVSLVLVVGILLLLSGTVGKAIYTKQLVGGEEGGYAGEITYDVQCTPPHILTPEKDACCLDETGDGICDFLEERALAEMADGRCTDNYHCTLGEYCIDSQCAPLESIYKGKGDCSKMCYIYAAKIITSDDESYNVKPKMGSYTAAGALEWKLMESPLHCKGESPVLPVKIIRKRPGEIIGEEVITLSRRETSAILTHPDLSLAFTLQAQYIYESCPE